MDDEDEIFDPTVYVVGFSSANLREPTMLELAEYMDMNNMMWFCATKCMMIQQDIMHESDDMEMALREARAAQAAVLAWWEKMMIPRNGVD